MPSGATTSSPISLRSGFAVVFVCAVGATMLLPNVQAMGAGLPVPEPLLAGVILLVAALAAWVAIVRPGLTVADAVDSSVVPPLDDVELVPTPRQALTNASGPEKPQRQLYVLVVDDDVPSQLIAQTMLAQLGHIVNVCGDGEEAISRAVGSAYDVVLMDIQMPAMNGIEACKALHALIPPEKRPTIIALTSHVGDGAQERFDVL